MSDIQMMKDQIDGMVTKGKELRKKEAVFLKLQGLNEEIAKASADRNRDNARLDIVKSDLKDLKEKKQKSIAGVAKSITQKMNAVLPIGEAVFNVDDGVFFGWNDGQKQIPYDGLSGGQKQVFDVALAHTFQANILVLEAGELDNDHLTAALEDAEKLDSQVLVCTCHPLTRTAPKSFKTVVIGDCQ